MSDEEMASTSTDGVSPDSDSESSSSISDAVNVIAIGRRKYDVRFLKLKEIFKPKTTTTVWQHFGVMSYNGITIETVKDKIYCKMCFEKRDCKPYKLTTATGNLHEHLAKAHDMVLKKVTTDQNQKKISNMLFSKESEVVPTKRDAQFLINRRICLWLCRDLQPFNVVEKPGFKSLWGYLCKWLPFKLPSRSTVSIAALNDIYASIKTKLIETLQSMPEHAAISFDGWTDKYKHRKYLTFTYHCIDKDWQTKSYVLKTALFAESSITMNIRHEYLTLIEEFKLEDKSIQLVTDSGSNMRSTCRSLELPHYPCLAHKVHNLITDDLLPDSSMVPLNELVKKLSTIQTTLLYSHSELEEGFAASHRENYFNFLLECVDFGRNKILKCILFVLSKFFHATFYFIFFVIFFLFRI